MLIMQKNDNVINPVKYEVTYKFYLFCILETFVLSNII